MNNIENLTLFQKIAIEGEVSLLFSSVRHDLQLLKRLYLVLSTTPSDVASYILQIVRNITTFPEEEINKVVLEVSLKEYPEWLWIENIIEDIKTALKISESDYVLGSNLHLDKKMVKAKIVKSAFTYFCREVGSESEVTVARLCKRVLDENDLEFLFPICVSFLEEVSKDIDEILDDERTTYISEDIFEMDFNPSEILSFKLEKKVYNKFLKMGGLDNKEAKLKVVINKPQQPSIAKEKSKHLYEVVKSFKGSSKSSVLVIFKSKEEAKDYIENLETNYPELKNTCIFEVRETINNDGTEI